MVPNGCAATVACHGPGIGACWPDHEVSPQQDPEADAPQPAGRQDALPGGTRQANVREDALEHPPIKKLIEAGTLEVVEGASTKRAASSNQALGGGQAHAPRAKVQSGDR
jgi:hypothetical protein